MQLEADLTACFSDCIEALGVDGTCGMFGGIGVLALPLPYIIESKQSRITWHQDTGGQAYRAPIACRDRESATSA